MSDDILKGIKRVRRHRVDPDILYGVRAISDHIEKALSTTYKIVERKPKPSIPAYKVGGEWRMRKSVYAAWLANQLEAA